MPNMTPSHFSKSLLAIIFIFLLAPSVLHAGNPLYMTPEGTPLVWDTSEPIRYVVDAKGLGKLNFEQSLALIHEATQIWESITGTGIQFEFAGTTEEPITIDNWKTIAGNTMYAEGYNVIPAGTSESQTEHLLVIGFDNTGEIIEAKGSGGASGVQSLTGVKGTLEDPEFIISSHVFINGLYHNGSNDDISELELTDLLAIVVHELGHALGLDHNVFHYEIYKQIIQGTLDPDYARYLPSMFPRFIKSTGSHMITLHPDDIATIKWLYGADDVTMLSGEVLDSQYQPVPSIVVTARETSSSLCQSYGQATSVTCSDMNTAADGSGSYQFNAKNCVNENERGYYQIPVLFSGNYTLDAQEIPEFLTSSVAKLGSKIQEIPGGAEFYNLGDSNTDVDSYSYDEIQIDGSDQDELDIILNDTTASSNDIDRIEFTFFSSDEFFTLPEDDVDCPLVYDYDANEKILQADVSGLITDAEASSINSSSTGDSNANTENSTEASASCSLNTNMQTSSQSFLLYGFGLICTGLLVKRRLPSK